MIRLIEFCLEIYYKWYYKKVYKILRSFVFQDSEKKLFQQNQICINLQQTTSPQKKKYPHEDNVSIAFLQNYLILNSSSCDTTNELIHNRCRGNQCNKLWVTHNATITHNPYISDHTFF